MPGWIARINRRLMSREGDAMPTDQFFDTHFGITPDVMRRLLDEALARGGEYADLFFEYRVSSLLDLEEDIVRQASRGIIVGVGIRVIHGEQTGYAYSDDLSMDTMLNAARTASHIAHTGSRVPTVAITPRYPDNRYPVERLATETALDDKLRLIERANLAAKRHDARIARVSVSLTDDVRRLLLVTSDGILTHDVQPMLRFTVSCIAEAHGTRQDGSRSGGGRIGLEYFDSQTPEILADDAARMAVLKLDAREAPAGPQEVVLGSADSGILLHEAVGHGLEADFNRKQLSNYSGRIGERVASPLCTIIDEGTLPNSRGSINVDDEGNFPSQNVLIEDGVLRSYLHDRMSAKLMGTVPTGNGRRQAYNYAPMPRMTNTYLCPGDADPDEIIRSVKRGVYAKRFGGGQVDITKGDFVFGVNEGYLIEDGHITAPLRNVTLIGNGPDVMTKVVMVGNDLAHSDGMWTCGKLGQSVPVGVGTPTVKISDITVGGTGT